MFSTPFRGTGRYTHGLPGTPSIAIGSTISATGTANTKGSWTTLISALAYDVNMLCLVISDTQTDGGGANDGVVIDIGAGTGGSFTVVIPDLLVSRIKPAGAASLCPMQVMLPIRIAKGLDIGCRLQSSSTSRTASVGAWTTLGQCVPSFSYVGCDAYGVTTSSATSGTSHTPGNSGTFSSWASVGSTMSRDYKAALLVVDGEEATATSLLYYHFELGYNSRNPLLMVEWAYTSAAEGRYFSQAFPTPMWIPSGTQLEVRATCSGTAEVQEVGIYCFY